MFRHWQLRSIELKKWWWVMGTRVKVFTDPLDLDDEKLSHKNAVAGCWNGNVRWQRGSLCFAEQFVRHNKKLLSGRANVPCSCNELSFLASRMHLFTVAHSLTKIFLWTVRRIDPQWRSACRLPLRPSLISSVNHGAERWRLTQRVTAGAWRSMAALKPAL